MDKNNLTQALESADKSEIFGIENQHILGESTDSLDTEEARKMIAEYARIGNFDSARLLFLTTISVLNEWSNNSPEWLQEVSKLVLSFCEMEDSANNSESVQQAAFRLLDLCRIPVKEIDESPIAYSIADTMEKIVEILTKNRQYLIATSLLNRILSMRIAISKKSDTVSNMNKSAAIMEKMAISTHMQGHLNEAEKLFRTTLAVREAACERDDAVVQKWYKAGTLELIGDLYAVMGSPKQAYTYFGQCINILEEAKLQAVRPDRVLRHITSIRNKLGDVALNTNDYVQARIFYDESFKNRKDALTNAIDKGHADTERPTRDLVFSLLRISDLDFREGNIDQAETKLNEAIAILDNAINENGERIKLLESYYVPLDRLIRIQAQKGNASEHSRLIEKMSKLLRRLVALAPENPTYRRWFEEF